MTTLTPARLHKIHILPFTYKAKKIPSHLFLLGEAICTPYFKNYFRKICLLRVKKEPLTCIHWERSFGDGISEKNKKYTSFYDGEICFILLKFSDIHVIMFYVT